MKHADAQKAIDTLFQGAWTATPLQFENQPFNTDLYEEFTRITVQFGDTIIRSLGSRCYRTVGVLFVDFFVRPGSGTHRLAYLADLAMALVVGQTTGTDPVVNFIEPSLSKDLAERTGWVSAQLRVTFYFDTEA